MYFPLAFFMIIVKIPWPARWFKSVLFALIMEVSVINHAYFQFMAFKPYPRKVYLDNAGLFCYKKHKLW
jgi:hypothetical protein